MKQEVTMIIKYQQKTSKTKWRSKQTNTINYKVAMLQKFDKFDEFE